MDFERAWLDKLAASLERVAGAGLRQAVLAGSEELSDSTRRREVITWSQRAMALLDERLSEEDRTRVMTGCACQYPPSQLRTARQVFVKTGNIDRVMAVLQDEFLSFLRDGLGLEPEIIAAIVENKWGLAGYRDEQGRIIVTKIPKSGEIRAYFAEPDPVKKRAVYCHCPRIRDALRTGTSISATYCYCGAGYYQGIWEEILQRPVKLALLASVLRGDDVCRFAIDTATGD